jgi:anti-sigma factor RsiW
MKCKKAVGMISDYIDGTLSGIARREIELHLAECSDCNAEVEATRDLVSRLSSLSCSDNAVDCWSGVKEKIACKRMAIPWWSGRLFRPVFAAPAFALVAILAFVLMWSGRGPFAPSPAASPPPEYASYISAHLRVQRMQAFNDPDVPFIAAELEKASLSGDSAGQ